MGEHKVLKPFLSPDLEIKIDFREIMCESVDWIQLAQNKVRLRVLLNAVL
jgi:hypothetical protein